ncbi:MAG: sn-glycerol-3-phosphate ABC transporter ATP-binding protein UgpC [Candidatus Marinimicrobia bacterium]|nr:sn-glycerol-3-phosphate ABC transporter ATP-binding protein UgpC [Candidatus Neomarinimicrobiota bacterium]
MGSVTIENVTKIYDEDVVAIDNASLEIEDKDFLVLVGPSGCGKSTLLRMIAGLENITKGSIYIDEERINNVAPKNRDIAMVFQNYALYPHMTVYDNMGFGLKLRKFDKETIEKRVRETAEILEIEPLLDRRPKALSGGQRQRVALGRAIVRDPKVFLFDEPLSNLDAKLRVQMRIEIKRLYNELNTTMIYVTHDQVEAMTMGNKIAVLRDGRIQQVDSPLNLYNDPQNKFVADFIGSPSMNFIEGTIELNGSLEFRSPLITFPIPDSIGRDLESHKDSTVILGVRPEDMYDTVHPRSKNLTQAQEVPIDVVEPMGNEIYLYFGGKEHSYCMRTPADRQYQSQDTLSLGLDFDKLYFFDSDSEERLH